MTVSVGRSSWRFVAYALIAVPMVLLALDMTIAYRFIPEPETTQVVLGETTNAAGETIDITKDVYTRTGEAQRRRDVVFGGGLLLAGVAAMAWAVRELVRPGRVLVADDHGLSLRVWGRRGDPLQVPWPDIVEVRSGLMDDEGAPVSVLSIRFVDDDHVPERPLGGVAEPPWLHLYADDWDRAAHQVAALLDVRVHRPAEEAR